MYVYDVKHCLTNLSDYDIIFSKHFKKELVQKVPTLDGPGMYYKIPNQCHLKQNFGLVYDISQ